MLPVNCVFCNVHKTWRNVKFNQRLGVAAKPGGRSHRTYIFNGNTSGENEHKQDRDVLAWAGKGSMERTLVRSAALQGGGVNATENVIK